MRKRIASASSRRSVVAGRLGVAVVLGLLAVPGSAAARTAAVCLDPGSDPRAALEGCDIVERQLKLAGRDTKRGNPRNNPGFPSELRSSASPEADVQLARAGHLARLGQRDAARDALGRALRLYPQVAGADRVRRLIEGGDTQVATREPAPDTQAEARRRQEQERAQQQAQAQAQAEREAAAERERQRQRELAEQQQRQLAEQQRREGEEAARRLAEERRLVLEVEKRLVELRLLGRADGEFDEAALQAVRKLARDRGTRLPEVPDQALVAALDRLVSEKQTAERKAADLVRRAEAALVTLGRVPGPADGSLDARSGPALDAFRRETGRAAAAPGTPPDEPVVAALEAAAKQESQRVAELARVEAERQAGLVRRAQAALRDLDRVAAQPDGKMGRATQQALRAEGVAPPDGRLDETIVAALEAKAALRAQEKRLAAERKREEDEARAVAEAERQRQEAAARVLAEAERQRAEAERRLVADLQRLLAELGFAVAGREGGLDEPTAAAIREFQAREGLPADGVPSVALLARVESAVARKRAEEVLVAEARRREEEARRAELARAAEERAREERRVAEERARRDEEARRLAEAERLQRAAEEKRLAEGRALAEKVRQAERVREAKERLAELGYGGLDLPDGTVDQARMRRWLDDFARKRKRRPGLPVDDALLAELDKAVEDQARERLRLAEARRRREAPLLKADLDARVRAAELAERRRRDEAERLLAQAERERLEVERRLVGSLQERLAELGAPLPRRDGTLDEPTSGAIREFQAREGLTVDGRPDAALVDRLDVAVARKRVEEQARVAELARQEAERERERKAREVALLRRAEELLAALGFALDGPDGVADPKTRKALDAYARGSGRAAGAPADEALVAGLEGAVADHVERRRQLAATRRASEGRVLKADLDARAEAARVAEAKRLEEERGRLLAEAEQRRQQAEAEQRRLTAEAARRRMLAAVSDCGRQRSVEDCDAALDLAAAESPNVRFGLLLVRAEMLARGGGTEGAKTDFDAARALAPRDLRPLVGLARLEFDARRPEAARDLYRAALALDPGSAIARDGLAEAERWLEGRRQLIARAQSGLAELGQAITRRDGTLDPATDAALGAFAAERRLARDPSGEPVTAELVQAIEAEAKDRRDRAERERVLMADARRHLEELGYPVGRNAADPAGREALRRFRADKGLGGEGVDERVVAALGEAVEVLRAEAAARRAEEVRQAAREDEERRAEERRLAEEQRVLTAEVAACRDRGELDACDRVLGRVTLAGAERADTLRYRALILHYDRRDTRGALGDIERALALAPEVGQLWYNKGEFLSQLGSVDEAIVAFREAERRDGALGIQVRVVVADLENQKAAALQREESRKLAERQRQEELLARARVALPRVEPTALVGDRDAVRFALRAYMRKKGLPAGEPLSDAVVEAVERDVEALVAQDKTVPVLEVAERVAYDDERRGALVRGRVLDEGSGIDSVTVEGRKVQVSADATFEHVVRGVLPNRDRKVEVVVRDKAGNEERRTVLATWRLPGVAEAVEQLVSLNPYTVPGRPQPDAVAIVVGVGKYKEISPAKFAAEDAEQFAQYALNVLGVPAERIALLTNEEATITGIEEAVDDTLQRAADEGPIGPVYLFFSGHGFGRKRDKEPLFLPHDFNERNVDRWSIAQADLLERVARYEPRWVALFADACFSGRSRENVNLLASAKLLEVDVEPTPAGRSAAVLTSSSGSALSVALDKVSHGAFSYVLMRGLEGPADGDGDKRITMGELHAWVAQRLPKLAATPDGKAQEPSYNMVDPERVLVELE